MKPSFVVGVVPSLCSGQALDPDGLKRNRAVGTVLDPDRRHRDYADYRGIGERYRTINCAVSWVRKVDSAQSEPPRREG